jgi:hypothetical protein
MTGGGAQARRFTPTKLFGAAGLKKRERRGCVPVHAIARREAGYLAKRLSGGALQRSREPAAVGQFAFRDGGKFGFLRLGP